MRYFVIAAVLALGGCGQQKPPPIAGGLTKSEVCHRAAVSVKGQLAQLGTNFSTDGVHCNVNSTGVDAVEIWSGYVTPFGTTMTYTAQAVVRDGGLIIETIHVHGERSPIPFQDFP